MILQRHRKPLIGIAIALVVYAILGFLLAPWLIQRTATNAVRENLGVELRLRDVAVNPFVLSLRIDGLELDEPSGDPFVTIERIFINFQLSSLFRWAATFREFHIDSPRVRIARNGDGKLNLDFLMQQPAESVESEKKYRIYVNAMTQLSVDRHNRILTSDTRLIRRIVRDRFFRGYTTAQTISGWHRVREGERKYIYPWQEEADVMFNSALFYEPAVMRVFAERFLLEVPRENPSYSEAYRLLKFIELFVPVFLDEVPQTSILREFVGGSSFRY